MTLTEELKDTLQKAGAVLIGIGDMSRVEGCDYPIGVSVAIPVPAQIVVTLKDAPTRAYYDMYYELNSRLNDVVLAGEQFLTERGYPSLAQTTDYVTVDDKRTSAVPHKTVATRAGLGWIGKNCLLVTPQYGPAIRLSSLLTHAPLDTGRPIQDSRCGGCRLCVKACPAQALKGTLWKAGMARGQIVDTDQCYEKQLQIMKEHTGIETDLCGKCFAVCAYTQGYLGTCAT